MPNFRNVPIREFEASLVLHYETTRATSTADGIKRLVRQVVGLPGVTNTFDLTPEMVDRFILKRRKDGVCENTIVGEVSRLKAICNFAVRRRVLEEAPFTKGEKLVRPEQPAKLSHLSMDQLSTFLAHLKREIQDGIHEDDKPAARRMKTQNAFMSHEWRARRLYALVATYALTGARKMEILCCWKADVDLKPKQGILLINSERRRLKTLKSHRRVPIVPQLREVLEEWLPHSGPSDFLFPGALMKSPWTTGGPGRNPLDCIRAAGERAGIQGVHIHLFRHSWLSHAEAWGIPQAGAQKITGITQERTLQFYEHRDNAMLHNLVGNVRITLPPLEEPSRLERLQSAMSPSAN